MKSLPLFFAALCTSVLCSGCLGLDGAQLPGTGVFDPVDEDYSRPAPDVEPDGALQRECEAEPDNSGVLLQTRERVFRHALCLCGDLKDVGSGLMTRSDSHLRGDDGGKGHVGINGSIDSVGDLSVDGTLDVAKGLQGVGNVTVEEDLLSGGDVDITGSWSVGRDAWVARNLSGVGSIQVGGDLYLGGDLRSVGNIQYDTGHRGFDYGAPPCPCGSGESLDVAAEVAAHRTDNDNALLPDIVGDQQLILESGDYYFSGQSQLVGSAGITVRGRASVYVEGDIESIGNLQIAVEPSGELELWVAGTVQSVGNLQLAAGDERPRAFKLFMGGEGSAIMNVGNAQFFGAVYAPDVDIEYVGNLQVFGSLFANNLDGTGNLQVFYDTDLTTPGECAEKKYNL